MNTMIEVTRLNGTQILVNADLIELVEETPDTSPGFAEKAHLKASLVPLILPIPCSELYRSFLSNSLYPASSALATIFSKVGLAAIN